MLGQICAAPIWSSRSKFSLHDTHQLRDNTSREPTTSSRFHTLLRNIKSIRSYTYQLEENDGAVEHDEPSSLRNLAEDCKPSLPALKQLSVEATSLKTSDSNTAFGKFGMSFRLTESTESNAMHTSDFRGTGCSYPRSIIDHNSGHFSKVSKFYV
jgi:hypothetical protein